MIKLGTWDLDLIDIPARKLRQILDAMDKTELVNIFVRLINNLAEIEAEIPETY